MTDALSALIFFFPRRRRERILARLMPLYEYRKNATNHVAVPAQIRQEVVCGTQPVLSRMLGLARERQRTGQPATVAIDGWYGVDWAALKAGFRDAANAQGLTIEIVSTAELFQSAAAIETYRRPFVTDDPSFGRVNGQGVLEDILDARKLDALKSRLDGRAAHIKTEVLIVIGPGAAVTALAG